MRTYVQGERAQAGREQREEALGRRHVVGQRQVQQHGGGKSGERFGCAVFGRLRSGVGFQRQAQLCQREPRAADIAQRKVGVGVDQAGGQSHRQIFVSEQSACDANRLFRLSAEIIVFGLGDRAHAGIVKVLDDGLAGAGGKGGVHKGHQPTENALSVGRAACDTFGRKGCGGRMRGLGGERVGWKRLFWDVGARIPKHVDVGASPLGLGGVCAGSCVGAFARVCRLFCICGYDPRAAHLARTGDASFSAQALDASFRDAPFRSGLPCARVLHCVPFRSPSLTGQLYSLWRTEEIKIA